MRNATLLLVLVCVSTEVACSFSTDFVVVNASDYPAVVLYKIGETGIEPLRVTRTPATLDSSQMRSRDWKELSSSEYLFDLEKRTVTVSIMPGKSLRINQGGEWRERETPANFIIKEIEIRGTNGEITLKGDQVYKSFVPESKPFFGPPTVVILTYK